MRRELTRSELRRRQRRINQAKKIVSGLVVSSIIVGLLFWVGNIRDSSVVNAQQKKEEFESSISFPTKYEMVGAIVHYDGNVLITYDSVGNEHIWFGYQTDMNVYAKLKYRAKNGLAYGDVKVLCYTKGTPDISDDIVYVVDVSGNGDSGFTSNVIIDDDEVIFVAQPK